MPASVTTVARRPRAGQRPPNPAPRRRRTRAELFGRLVPYLLLAPAVAFFVTVMLVPMGKAVQVSLYEWSPIPGAENTFLGGGNYTRAFGDAEFGRSVVNAVVYMLVTVPGQIVLGLILALLLNNRLPGRTLFRVLFYLPVVTSWVVVSLLFRYLFANDGALNWLLVEALGVSQEPVGWLDSRWTAMVTLCALGIWKGVGWTAVILLAGLQGVPAEQQEAAAVDGAGYLRRLWHVTLPALRRTLLFVTILLGIGGLQAFIQVLLLTDGGPAGQTEMPLTYVYKQAFDFLDFGYGSALAVLMTAAILIVSITQTTIFNRLDRGVQ
ncbi:sugar ABC transporter permease [Dactylosporangium sp. NPDC005572]|uniref:carbohydrate ABC transporter permease n=1 Tax=Dactylosporangium sp. NPDC005572 TaxID=3156889 RepID=UPI0033B26FA0